ncbi:DEAD/DEAH box helicase [bacterium]|nr:DEAD/DEAH box helicase [bacterium]
MNSILGDTSDTLAQVLRVAPARLKQASPPNKKSALPDSVWLKVADLNPDIQLYPHQTRVSDQIVGANPRLLVYHGLGSGKSSTSLAAAEEAKKRYGEDYGIVVPASLRGNFEKEIAKFTRNSDPEIMSYTGLALGKKFQQPPDTLIMDEAHRLRNPGSASSAGAAEAAAQAKRLMLLTGSPITNSPTDLANLLSMLNNKEITPEEFEKRYIDYKTVRPGLFGWLRGVKPGVKPVVKNEKELRSLLRGKVDYHPSKAPEGVNVNDTVVRVPLSAEQQKIQKAIRTKIPPGFLWKLDQEFPLSKDELAKLNSFLTGLRQVSLSTQPFRADKDPAKAFQQSAKLQTAFQNLQKTLNEDKRKKAIIYSNFIDSGLAPYAAGLEKAKIPHAFFHGGVSTKARQAAVDAYNQGKLRALLIGPAGAEGLSTKGTSLIQLLDPHWHESRSQQARGRGLRFDSHRDLPEELKNVQVQRYLSASQDPSFLGKLMGYQRERTGDEVLEHLTAEKEQVNELFRKILKEEGSRYKEEKEQEKQAISSRLVTSALNKGLTQTFAGKLSPERMARLIERATSWSNNTGAKTYNFAKHFADRQKKFLSRPVLPKDAPVMMTAQSLEVDDPGLVRGWRLPKTIRQVVTAATNQDSTAASRRFIHPPRVINAPSYGDGLNAFYAAGNPSLSDAQNFILGQSAKPTQVVGARIVGAPNLLNSPDILFHELGHHIDLSRMTARQSANLAQRYGNAQLLAEARAWRAGSKLYRNWLKKLKPEEAAQNLSPRELLAERRIALDTYHRGNLHDILRDALSAAPTQPAQLTDAKRYDRLTEKLTHPDFSFGAAKNELGKKLYVFFHGNKQPAFAKLLPAPQYTPNLELNDRTFNNAVVAFQKQHIRDAIRAGADVPQELRDLLVKKSAADVPNFTPDFTPGQLHRMGVYKSLYEKEGPRLASLGEWKPEWVTEHDPKGWLEWYQNYNSGRRIPDEDTRQIKRWASFKARHGGPFMSNPTPRRGWALQHWAIDPAKLVSRTRADGIKTMLQAYQEQELKKYLKRRRRELTKDEAQEKTGAVFKELSLTPKRPLSKKKRRLLKYPDVKPQPSKSILDSDE